MRKLIYIISVLTIMGIAFACSKVEDANPIPDANQSGSIAGPKFLAVKSIISGSCALSGYHVSPVNAGGVGFQSDENIVIHGAHIKERAVDLGTMPPSGPISAANKAIITDWINSGGRLTD